MLELERTFLAAKIPEGLAQAPYEEMADLYIEAGNDHPDLRLRRKGEQYEITRKRPAENDPSKQTEETIKLTQTEYESLCKSPGRLTQKRRYFLDDAEIDVFLENLEGLVLVDFEFTTEADMAAFQPPSYCLSDVSQLATIAGGLIAGKTFDDIYPSLRPYRYQKLSIAGLLE